MPTTLSSDASKGSWQNAPVRATLAGNEFGKFTQKKSTDARALGTITPSANNAKDKVKELVGGHSTMWQGLCAHQGTAAERLRKGYGQT